MEKFVAFEAVAVPIEGANVDTDQIVPARFLHHPRSRDFGAFLFHDLRFDTQGAVQPGYVLNRPAYQGARIVVADENFGCGSSREHAPWALFDYGVRCVVAPSFGDIFYNNSLKNGLLPVRLPAPVCAEMRAALTARPGARMAVDLERQSLRAPDGTEHHFDIDPFWKTCLIKGLDDIGLTLEYRAEIEAFERDYNAARPFLHHQG